MLQVTLPDELPRAHHEPPLVSCTFTSRAAVGAIARVTLSRFVDVSASSLEPLLPIVRPRSPEPPEERGTFAATYASRSRFRPSIAYSLLASCRWRSPPAGPGG